MTSVHIELLRGEAARSLIAQPAFQTEWQTLAGQADGATAFQRPAFVCSWYLAYADRWEPVLVLGRGAAGDLQALWPLALDGSRLVHAGAHQAEYQGWLATPAVSDGFVREAWSQLNSGLGVTELRARYMVSGDMARQLAAATQGRAIMTSHPRPVLRLNAEEIRASAAKKGNKSRFNRLARLGAVEFLHMTDRQGLAPHFGDLIDFYDLRQGAINQTSPFREDAHKRAFHEALMASGNADVVATATLVGGQAVAGFWGLRSHDVVHLGMLMHSPMLAEHSPGKLHMMKLSELLLAQGVAMLDLTPGGDAWKERFANDHDEVFEVHAYGTASAWQRRQQSDRLSTLARRALKAVGTEPSSVRSVVTRLKRGGVASALMRRVRARLTRDESHEYRIYRLDASSGPALAAADDRVLCNHLDDLLRFEPGETWQTREAFLSSALARLEAGEEAYTIVIDGRLAHCGWLCPAATRSIMSEVDQSMSFPPGSSTMYDFYTHPDFRGRGLYRAALRHMLGAAFAHKGSQQVYIGVLADNMASRHVIERIGFVHLGAFHRTRKGADVRLWTSGEVQAQVPEVAAPPATP